jgi:hypothetical protein
VGVFDNVITGNTSNGNGLGTPSRPNASSGSGVILAADGKSGGVWGNTIESNQLSANGHAGVVVHAHAPGLNFSGDEIIDNTIGVNNLRTDYKDTATTGVYLGAASALRITVAGNTIERDAVGVFSAGPVTVLGMASNSLVGVGQPSASVAKF